MMKNLNQLEIKNEIASYHFWKLSSRERKKNSICYIKIDTEWKEILIEV